MSAFRTRAVVVVLGVFAALGTVTFVLNERLFAETDRIGRGRNVQFKIADVLTHATEAETGQRGYLLTGDDVFLLPYWQAVRVLDADIRELADLTADDPEQSAHLRALDGFLQAKMAELARTIELRQKGDTDAALARVRTGYGRTLMDQLRAVVEKMNRLENDRVAGLRVRHLETLRLIRVITIGGTAFGVGAVFVLGGFASRRATPAAAAVPAPPAPAPVLESTSTPSQQ